MNKTVKQSIFTMINYMFRFSLNVWYGMCWINTIAYLENNKDASSWIHVIKKGTYKTSDYLKIFFIYFLKLVIWVIALCSQS